MTNGDTIRNKSDRELAIWFTYVEERILHRMPMLEKPAMERDWFEWLQKEAKPTK